MELAIAPPSRIAAGISLQTPLVVTFTTGTQTDKGEPENSEPLVLPDLSGVWAFVSLTTPDMQQSLAPPQTDLLRGRTADSIHPVYAEQEGESATIAYATFPELAITKPGQYRIKVNIIDMNTSFLADSEQAAGTVLPSLHSQVFDVVESDEHDVCEATLAENITRLRSIGIDC